MEKNTHDYIFTKEYVEENNQKREKMKNNLKSEEENIRNIFGFENDIEVYKKDFEINLEERIPEYIKRFSELGINKYGHPIQEDEIENFKKLNNNLLLDKIFYMHEIYNDEEVIEYYKNLIKKEFEEDLSGYYFGLEIITTKYIGWHEDRFFNTERDTLYGNLLMCIDSPKDTYYLESESGISLPLNKNNIYYLNDYQPHRLIFKKEINEETMPVTLLCIKLNKNEYMGKNDITKL